MDLAGGGAGDVTPHMLSRHLVYSVLFLFHSLRSAIFLHLVSFNISTFLVILGLFFICQLFFDNRIL